MNALRELQQLTARHARPGLLAAIEHHDLGLKLIVARRGAIDPFEHVLGHSFGFVVQGEAHVGLGGRRLTCGAGSYFAAGVEGPVALRVPRASPSEPFVAVSVLVRPGCVQPLLPEAPPASSDDIGLAVSAAPTDVVDPLVRLVRLLDRPCDIAVLGPLVARELLWRLLGSHVGSRLGQIGRSDGWHAQIGRATRQIRDHYRGTLRIEDLARLAGMSATSFHRHFRAVAGVTPLQYQKQLRLQAAHSALLGGDEDVARIGHAVGYESASQFSREYKRAYGVPPGQARSGRAR